jgi:hypothetical protein
VAELFPSPPAIAGQGVTFVNGLEQPWSLNAARTSLWPSVPAVNHQAPSAPSKRRWRKARVIGAVASVAMMGAGAYFYNTWDGTTTPTGSCTYIGQGLSRCTNLGGENFRRDGGLLLMMLGGAYGLVVLFM